MTSDVLRTGKHALLLVAALGFLAGCTKEPEYHAQQFVGAWKSSRLASRPIHLMANGDWEIRAQGGGKPLQYGVWQLHGKSIVWTHRLDGVATHYRNPIMSMAPRRFVLREQDGSHTQFDRLEELAQ